MKILTTFFSVLTIFTNLIYSQLPLNHTYIDNYNYNDYISKYNKTFTYDNLEIYDKNVKYINTHNDNNNNSYKLEINKFTDTDNYESIFFKTRKRENIIIFEDNFIVPFSKDWRKYNAVTNVKNQGNCGSCWSFSTTGSIEGIVSIKTGKLFNVSEQQLIDCSSDYGNHGCYGGLMDNGFKYVINNGGLCSEKDYPYIAEEGDCQECKPVVKISNYGDIESNNEKILKRAVAQQPVSVAIQANVSSFRFYSNGIYSDPMCGNKLDHGVLLVGYGYDLEYDMDYWIIKNSWGDDWGENGNIRIKRNTYEEGGMCGVTLQASNPEI